MISAAVCTLALFVRLAAGYPDGAPVEACPTMLPLHGGAAAQDGAGTYVINVEPAEDGSVVGGTLATTSSGDIEVEGWMIQAQTADGMLVEGTFHLSDMMAMLSKTIMCGGSANDTLTHSGKGCKSGEDSSHESSDSHSAESDSEGDSEGDSASAESEESGSHEGSDSDSHEGGGGGGMKYDQVRELAFVWTPPAGFAGEVAFVATVLEDFDVFYTGVRSDAVTIAAK